jgi:guanine deaminase
MRIGVGSDVAGGPELSLFSVARIGAYAQNARRVAHADPQPPLSPSGWLRLATLDGARAIGLEDVIGSLEAGKEADFIAVDPSRCDPVPWLADDTDEPDEVLGRLIFRTHPSMVRGAWVRGRLLEALDDD